MVCDGSHWALRSAWGSGCVWVLLIVLVSVGVGHAYLMENVKNPNIGQVQIKLPNLATGLTLRF